MVQPGTIKDQEGMKEKARNQRGKTAQKKPDTVDFLSTLMHNGGGGGGSQEREHNEQEEEGA